MTGSIPNSPFRLVLAAILLLLTAGNPASALAEEDTRKSKQEDAEWTLVRVNITTETRGGGEAVVINGRVVNDYRPRVIHVFPSTGIVMDDKGNVLAFLGYRWVDLQGPVPRIDIVTRQGEKYKGQLIGIDQNIGVAVIRSEEGKLRRTPLCERCPLKDGITVVTPVLQDSSIAQFQSAQIVSIGDGRESQTQDVWTIKLNRPLPGVGEPLLNSDRRVLGFVSSQKASPSDPAGESTVIYHPMSQLLASAEKILRAGGDIRTGWLGVFISDETAGLRPGLTIDNVQEGSPAQKAGLRPGDLLSRYNGKDIREARQFIRLVQDTPIGTTASMDIMRGGKPITLRALIEARKPAANPGRLVLNFPEGTPPGGTAMESDVRVAAGEAWRGLEMVPLNTQLADFLQVPGKSGLLILSVEPQTSFGLAGVQAGDVILTVDGKRIQNPQNFFAHLKAQGNTARNMILRVFRKGSELVMTIRLSNSNTPAPK